MKAIKSPPSLSSLSPLQDSAIKAYNDLPQKGLSTGQKIDIVMAKARIAFALDDWPLAKKLLVEAKELNEKGGDWDRRNRLKVYEAILALVERGACGGVMRRRCKEGKRSGRECLRAAVVMTYLR